MTLQWLKLRPGAFGRAPTHPGADPMWIWADATAYRDHGPEGLGSDGRLWCVSEKDGVFCSERHTAGDGAALPDAELALPVVPERMPPPESRIDPPEIREPVGSVAGKVLVGVIDSGCPFAASMLRDAGDSTRVLALWDQDDAAAFADGGFLPAGFEYGRAIARVELNDFLRQARLPGGGIDEDHAYRLAGCKNLGTRLGHGAAVLSQLFGAPLHGGPLQPRPGDAPSWDQLGLAIDKADLVFVDLPRAGVQDASSAALTRYVIDGLRFILAHAARGQHVVVNISSGTSRTGHDGRSRIEKALTAAVKTAKAEGIHLKVVLPIGNNNGEQRHAVLSGPKHHLELFIPPACEMPQYVTLRWPRSASAARLRVTSPQGDLVVVGVGEALGLIGPQGACAGVIAPAARDEEPAGRWLLAFAPTASDDPRRALSPSGRWRIELDLADGEALVEPLQFWVSRCQRNPGALPRGRQADFVDWDRSHHPAAWQRISEDDPKGPALVNGIRRRGALSGMATATGHGGAVMVVGSMFVAGPANKPSPYSAASLVEPHFGPDVSAPGDTSRLMRGLSVRGNHGGEVVRVVGTSFSAPLVARALVNQALTPPATRGPEPLSPPPVARTGPIRLMADGPPARPPQPPAGAKRRSGRRAAS